MGPGLCRSTIVPVARQSFVASDGCAERPAPLLPPPFPEPPWDPHSCTAIKVGKSAAEIKELEGSAQPSPAEVQGSMTADRIANNIGRETIEETTTTPRSQVHRLPACSMTGSIPSEPSQTYNAGRPGRHMVPHGTRWHPHWSARVPRTEMSSVARSWQNLAKTHWCRAGCISACLLGKFLTVRLKCHQVGRLRCSPLDIGVFRLDFDFIAGHNV